jgi:large subunit ribosomal protein L18
MINKTEKKEIRGRIHKRIRRKLAGTTERPRLAIFRSVAHIYAQVIDDSKGATLVSASSVDKGARTKALRGWSSTVAAIRIMGA